ncbi:MAG: ROK family transcriptional regulator [Chloroflexota bacterium]
MFSRRDAIGHRSETVRRANLSAIVRALHLRGPLSRSELGVGTGLTRSTIRGLVGELAAAGLVDEEPSPSAGTPGRPSPTVRPDSDAALALALEINVDSLAVAIVGFGGTIHELVRVDRPRAHLSDVDITSDLIELARPQIDALRDDPSLVGVGVAIAGVVRRSDGMVRHSPNLGWRDVPIGERLTAALGLDAPLWVVNEADLGAVAEHRRGAAAGADAVLYVTGEVGVGGNLLLDGQPLVGAAGYAGEIGHLPVNPAGQRCGCGSVGCWETEIGERAMLARAGRRRDGGREAVSDVIAAARAGEPRALAAVDHVGTWLGIGLAGLVNVFNPTLIVLGGHFERIHPLVADRLEQVLDERALRASRELVSIVPASLGVDAPVLGAAELALEPFIADPASWLRDERRVAIGG